MDVRVYIIDEAALVVVSVPSDCATLSSALEARLAGFNVHAAANGVYDFVAVRR